MSLRIGFQITIALLTAALCSCGGGGSNSPAGTGGNPGGGGPGGSGGAPALSISILAPSSVMVGSELGIMTILGQDFSEQSQVLLDGKPVQTTFFVTSTTIQGQIDTSLNSTAGTHQFSVQDSGNVSNSLTFTVYTPQQGPLVMQAVPGFLVGETDPTFVLAADVNGDGLADVILPGPPLENSPGSIAILDGQSNGLLSAVHYISVPTTPYAMAIGDVDGNGTLDLVSITSNNSSSTTVSIMFGDGKGNFSNRRRSKPSQAFIPDPRTWRTWMATASRTWFS